MAMLEQEENGLDFELINDTAVLDFIQRYMKMKEYSVDELAMIFLLLSHKEMTFERLSNLRWTEPVIETEGDLPIGSISKPAKDAAWLDQGNEEIQFNTKRGVKSIKMRAWAYAQVKKMRKSGPRLFPFCVRTLKTLFRKKLTLEITLYDIRHACRGQTLDEQFLSNFHFKRSHFYCPVRL